MNAPDAVALVLSCTGNTRSVALEGDEASRENCGGTETVVPDEKNPLGAKTRPVWSSFAFFVMYTMEFPLKAVPWTTPSLIKSEITFADKVAGTDPTPPMARQVGTCWYPYPVSTRSIAAMEDPFMITLALAPNPSPTGVIWTAVGADVYVPPETTSIEPMVAWGTAVRVNDDAVNVIRGVPEAVAISESVNSRYMQLNPLLDEDLLDGVGLALEYTLTPVKVGAVAVIPENVCVGGASETPLMVGVTLAMV